MIEAPEALYLCEQLNKTVKGKRITNVFTLFTPHKFAWFSGSPDEYAEWLTGKSIDHARSQGGMVEMTIGDKMLILTDGVNLRYYAPGTKLPAKHQLLIGFEDESCLIASVRMYGGIMCYSKDAANGVLSEYYRTAKSKPQVMSDAFSKEYFLGLINDESAQKKSVCTVFGCFLRKLDRCACRVGSCACDHRDTVVYTFNGKTDHFAVFLFGHCCRFSGRSADDDRICFSCNLFFE